MICEQQMRPQEEKLYSKYQHNKLKSSRRRKREGLKQRQLQVQGFIITSVPVIQNYASSSCSKSRQFQLQYLKPHQLKLFIITPVSEQYSKLRQLQLFRLCQFQLQYSKVCQLQLFKITPNSSYSIQNYANSSCSRQFQYSIQNYTSSICS